MSLEKITFLRDESKGSAEISKLFRKKKIEIIEVYSNSERGPSLLIPSQFYPIKGKNSIINYIKSNY
ncbi:hypothetical protein HYS72_01190 [Candidatus Pacearchaeota archaeon]|nr:hypothetical protein [Candidatus Pacearchaeota archaeon]MBI2057266.1 hypothetical protein [Candidatus Pacearchaeota archaeon]